MRSIRMEWNNLTGSEGAAAIIAILDDYLPDSSMYNQLITQCHIIRDHGI